jgi:hypothetical protein
VARRVEGAAKRGEHVDDPSVAVPVVAARAIEITIAVAEFYELPRLDRSATTLAARLA